MEGWLTFTQAEWAATDEALAHLAARIDPTGIGLWKVQVDTKGTILASLMGDGRRYPVKVAS